jgi:hypothetical protein
MYVMLSETLGMSTLVEISKTKQENNMVPKQENNMVPHLFMVWILRSSGGPAAALCMLLHAMKCHQKVQQTLKNSQVHRYAGPKADLQKEVGPNSLTAWPVALAAARASSSSFGFKRSHTSCRMGLAPLEHCGSDAIMSDEWVLYTVSDLLALSIGYLSLRKVHKNRSCELFCIDTCPYTESMYGSLKIPAPSLALSFCACLSFRRTALEDACATQLQD